MSDLEVFEGVRPALLALAYRMLGDVQSAEDAVQETWVRFSARTAVVDAPKPYLIKTITRLCLNELSSARRRRERAQSDRLPEPVSLETSELGSGLGMVEALDRISMAFLVLLQRLTPAERAALLLHDVFDFDHREIAAHLDKSEAACRKLLERARAHVQTERRMLKTEPETHRRLLAAFMRAAVSGDVDALVELLAEDVVLIVDAGPDGGRYGRVKQLPGPLTGARKVSAFVASVTAQGASGLSVQEVLLNAQPALLLRNGDGTPHTAILLAVAADDRIRGVFMQADPTRLVHV